MLYSIIAISLGAAVGAVLRWILGLQLNALLPAMPMGTLAANLLGGYLVGLAIGFFAEHPLISPEVRLFIITGFLGGLTTFSTFSAEVASLIQEGRLMWAAGTIGIHVTGSILLTIGGMMTISFFRS